MRPDFICALPFVFPLSVGFFRKPAATSMESIAELIA